LIATDKFKAWQHIQIAARIKGIADIDREVGAAMRPENIKIETYDLNSRQNYNNDRKKAL